MSQAKWGVSIWYKIFFDIFVCKLLFPPQDSQQPLLPILSLRTQECLHTELSFPVHALTPTCFLISLALILSLVCSPHFPGWLWVPVNSESLSLPLGTCPGWGLCQLPPTLAAWRPRPCDKGGEVLEAAAAGVLSERTARLCSCCSQGRLPSKQWVLRLGGGEQGVGQASPLGGRDSISEHPHLLSSVSASAPLDVT